MNGSPRTLSFAGLARHVVLAALAALASTIVQARTVYITPQGQTGYEADGTERASPLAYVSKSFEGLQPGDIVQLLATSRDPLVTTIFRGRVELSAIKAAQSPVTVRGLGARTRIVGQPLESFRCAMPRENVVGCGGAEVSDLEAVLRGNVGALRPKGQDLLDALLESGSPIRTAEIVRNPGEAVRFSINPNPAGSNSPLVSAACLDLTDVDGLVIEKLHFESCWLSAVRARSSQRITLRDAFIVGSSYGLAVGATPRESPLSGITVEGVTWIQDASGYDDPFAGTCRTSGPRGCPGEMWRTIPWGVSHHGAYEHFNGALLGGTNLAGDIVFKKNRIFNAFNGIRIKARPCSKRDSAGRPRVECPFNKGVWIYDNEFTYIRDNPVELEDWSENAHVFRNAFRNAHAWLSFDGMGGGPVFVYGNIGWFDDRPAIRWSSALREYCALYRRATVDVGQEYKFDARTDRKFDYDERHWQRVGIFELAEPSRIGDASEMRCETSVAGRVIKFGLPEKPTEEGSSYNFPFKGPVYVFNNSWYLRSPITGFGAPANLKHWNNAILFCDAGIPGYDAGLCDPGRKPTREECGIYARDDAGLDRYPGERGLVPFFDCFRWRPFDDRGRDVTDIDSEFDYDVSSIGFPGRQLSPEVPDFEKNGRAAQPGFSAPDRGDFILKPAASAGTSGCRIEETAPGRLACRRVEPSLAFAGAFDLNGLRYPGPPGERFQPPR
jgi:hypothetical protein